MAEMRATITMPTTTLSMRFWNIMSKIESLKVARSDFAQSCRMTVKCTVAKLRPARASQVTERKRKARRIRIVATEVFGGIVSARTDFSDYRKIRQVLLKKSRMIKQVNLWAL